MAKRKPKGPAADELSFEEALQQLEQIVHLLEEGDIGLGEALSRYEQGVKLLRRSYDLLEHTQRRIELLSGVDDEGNPLLQPVSDQATLARQEETKPAAEGSSHPGQPKTPPDDIDVDAPKELF